MSNVLTQHNDTSRTGANLQEGQLKTSNVNVNQFGKLFTRCVDGHIYAQPLFVSNIPMADGHTHNVVYVATMHNKVYAFDADSLADLWSPNPAFLGSWLRLPDPNIGSGMPNQQYQGSPGYLDITDALGILSTPVISLENNAIYVVAFRNISPKGGTGYSHWLHALDLTTGAEKFGGPIPITGSVPGSGAGNVSGTIYFTSNLQSQRPALLLANGNIYIAFASYEDQGAYSTPPNLSPTYHGWMFAYNATSLQQVAVYNTTPGGKQGGIWMAGQGPAADGQNMYCLTGNSGQDNGSFLQFQGPDLGYVNWYDPGDFVIDQDLGSGGALLIPNTNFLIGGGKLSILYLLNRFAMTLVQRLTVNASDPSTTHHIHGAPVFWNGPQGPWIYIWTENDFLKAYAFNGSTFGTTPVSTCTTTDPSNVPGGSSGMPGGILSISANGNGSGIVWASHPYSQDAEHAVVAGILRAYDASDLTRELWNSKQNPNRDDIGLFAKFCPPTIANGKVYMATFSYEFVVYGLLSAAPVSAAKFITQTAPPTSVVTGQAFTVQVTMQNTGTGVWDSCGPSPVRLGSQNPQDNTVWGLSRVPLPGPVAPNQQVTFTIQATAPDIAGSFNFQWRMVEESVARFGDFTPNVVISVRQKTKEKEKSEKIEKDGGDRTGAGAAGFGGSAPGFALPSGGEADPGTGHGRTFIDPAERPAVGEQALQEAEEG